MAPRDSNGDTLTAEPIARVIADLRAGRVRHVVPDARLNSMALSRVTTSTVVDSTAIYESLVAKDEPVWIYEDHPCIAPPWDNAAICYVNEHGNVIVMQVTADEIPATKRRQLWEPENPMDWADVRWILDTFVWVGGQGGEGPVPTVGPLHLWRFAVNEDGSPADMRWVHLYKERPLDSWDMAHLVLLGSLNFLGCRNVQLVEPERPRAQRKRIARLGVPPIRTINVTPVGKSYRADGKSSEGQGTPLTSVRGHFSHYGPQYGKGLLFGKFSGRFWVPQFARGSQKYGETEKDYRLATKSGGDR